MNRLVRFLVSHSASAFVTGVHMVMLAWIGMQVLHLSPVQWGLIQGAALAPNLLLMLVAGAWADRFDPAKLLVAAQLLLTLCFSALFLVLQAENGSFGILLIYAMCVGVGQAFIQPVREKLNAEIHTASIQQRISLLNMTQFAMQALGIGLAALMDLLSISLVLGIQACVSLFSALAFASLVTKQRFVEQDTTSTLKSIRKALVAVKQSRGLSQLMALIAFNGYMHMGVFLVMIPLVATRTYELNASEYAALQVLFVTGMVIANVFLLRQQTVEYPGQGALFSLLYTALVGFGLAKGPTPTGFYFLVFLWGLVAGNSAGRGRLVLQSLVTEEMRGRLMSVYQLVLFSAAPVGALVTGYVLDYLNHQQIFYFMSFSSIALFAVFMLTRTLWSVRQMEPPEEEM
ncbi:MAG: MFS transporter [Agarilytica sp.]